MNIAVTGGYGTGKTSVATILTSLLGAKFFSADLYCREQLNPGGEGWLQMKESWGERYFNDSGEIDRLKVKKKIFSDKNAKKELEKILHPLARKANRELAEKCQKEGIHLISEIPLLYENQLEPEFDFCLVVYVPDHIALQRGSKRDSLNEEIAIKIIRSQLTISEKVERADYVVNNSGMLTSTFSQLLHLSASL